MSVGPLVSVNLLLFVSRSACVFPPRSLSDGLLVRPRSDTQHEMFLLFNHHSSWLFLTASIRCSIFTLTQTLTFMNLPRTLSLWCNNICNSELGCHIVILSLSLSFSQTAPLFNAGPFSAFDICFSLQWRGGHDPASRNITRNKCRHRLLNEWWPKHEPTSAKGRCLSSLSLMTHLDTNTSSILLKKKQGDNKNMVVSLHFLSRASLILTALY